MDWQATTSSKTLTIQCTKLSCFVCEFSHALALWLIISHIFTSQFLKHEILLHDLQHYGQQSVEAEDAVTELLILLLRQRGS